MKMRQGTIIDAILIAAPSSTKNKAGEQDPEMHQTKKVNQWHFGMMVHIGVDKDTGLIHLVENIAAKVCDLSPAAELLLGEEEVVYGDVGYQGIDKRAEIEGKKMVFRTAMRPDKRRVLPDKPEGLENLVDSAKAHYTLAFPRPKAERGGATRLSTPAA
jgi:IS5 family transposase